MKAIITVGLGFGDEGKGATVDSLTRHFRAGLVVRYSGGAQAGHNVHLPDGRSHTFAQFGAGTLAGAKSYLGPRMVICPASMVPEAEHLQHLGIDNPWKTLQAHPDCLLATTYHQLMNRLRELDRGDRRHGSCGLGIGEARRYWLAHGDDAPVAADLRNQSILLRKLTLLRDRMLNEMQALEHLDPVLANDLLDWCPIEEADCLLKAGDPLRLSDRMPDHDTVIFEGSQGVLLDEWHGFHPYTTWSTVTPQHALEMLAHLADVPRADVEATVLGITRAYSTRHGAGPFPSHCPTLSKRMIDPGNPTNDWQGSIRFGHLDLVLTEYAARIANVDGIVVNGLDQLGHDSHLVTHYDSTERLKRPIGLRQQMKLTSVLEASEPAALPCNESQILSRLEEIAPVVITGHGTTHADRTYLGSFIGSESTNPPDHAIAARPCILTPSPF